MDVGNSYVLVLVLRQAKIDDDTDIHIPPPRLELSTSCSRKNEYLLDCNARDEMGHLNI